MSLFFDDEMLKDLPKENWTWDKHELGENKMNGKIARVLLAKKFGFIRGEDGKDYFFHQTDFSGFFEDLETDYKHGKPIVVTFEPTEGKKGLRAINITRLDGGV